MKITIDTQKEIEKQVIVNGLEFYAAMRIAKEKYLESLKEAENKKDYPMDHYSR